MRIAIVLENIYLAETNSNTRRIMLFEADGDLIIAIDKDIISISDINYLYLWLLAKQAVKLYCDDLTDDDVSFLKKGGIETYPLDKIRDHPILQGLLLKDHG